ncbi:MULTISPECIES: TetR/AcrR family transcriptional regulator [unclassified Ruegeria]|uniref:TetR/AcrR family transcriptional regulator n=1 Tax=unclassified Ruegeria TaxID=2625375 RepID=UPI001488D587|nr:MULTISPECIES: TetR/AcrR family transcriptional regulator [unclassified Ruegeria]NOD34959.1 TetR family transcriptional regulator [Ruegeria sp. HKCCD7296]NOD47961.1 TetR family transcriptional regulator [Ruegeria sp. HKCCD5849]NOD52945.1 TetR family transcriptional regulator [Ruegeria sp. HKCCD5851]NOD69091.1 TetR family transcriptional regulator [Ruegeria sp. HKCCD7303]NOE35203.1 TetR family transcriptional regulator [Ruegeria sp. HKCCD7318]
MQKAIQKRTIKTRAKLLSAAEAVVRSDGYQALRVEDVVKAAGVAKGTFFAHFNDKDALMEILIGERLNACLDQAEAGTPPKTVDEIIVALEPVHSFMTSERYVFDLLIRYSGATAIEDIGPIAYCFERYFRVVMLWLEAADMRKDVPPELLAEGVQAFAIQAMSLRFCALHSATTFTDRLETYLDAWLTPTS